MIVLVDQDDVLAEWDNFFTEHWEKKYPDKPIEQGRSFYKYIKGDYPEEYKSLAESIYCVPGFIRSLPPMPEGLEAVLEMDKLGLDVFICTSPLSKYENCVLEKYEWVENHLGRKWTKKIILTKDKTIVNGDVLIDDRPEISGVMVPSWEHIIFDQPYNQHIKDKRRIIKWKNWKEILKV
ncbi:MAG: 5'-3'-deoxyribonucleotidase [Nanoarchaeota archaeon]|nr:5'-3'-deoxyribonucleotidase [Nanoarchaeota archaeon]